MNKNIIIFILLLLTSCYEPSSNATDYHTFIVKKKALEYEFFMGLDPCRYITIESCSKTFTIQVHDHNSFYTINEGDTLRFKSRDDNLEDDFIYWFEKTYNASVSKTR